MSLGKSIHWLFILAKNGDQAAKNELYSILRVRVADLAKSRVAAAEVEDVVQDVLMTFSEKFERIESEAKVLPFLFSILSHKVGNRYQKARKLRETVFLEPVTIAHPKLLTTENPETNLGAAEVQARLAQALRIVRRRSPESAKIFRCLLRDDSIEQIREVLGARTLNNVYVKINRARKLLREILKKEFNLDI